MRKLLALNRGEIAIRIFRAANELGLKTVAVYSAEDRLSLHDLRNVRLNITADLGQCMMLVRDVLALKRGSVVALNKLAGEMTDLYANGIPLAKGEVVVIADSLHVRISEITGAVQLESGAQDEA